MIGPRFDSDDWPNCKSCGAGLVFEDCGICDDGYTHPGELYEEDPLGYEEDDVQPCHQCGGDGGWWICPNNGCPQVVAVDLHGRLARSQTW